MTTFVAATTAILSTSFAVSGVMLLLSADRVTSRLLALLGTAGLLLLACASLSAWINGGAGTGALLLQAVHALIPAWQFAATPTLDWTPYCSAVVAFIVAIGYMLSLACEPVPTTGTPYKANATPQPAMADSALRKV